MEEDGTHGISIKRVKTDRSRPKVKLLDVSIGGRFAAIKAIQYLLQECLMIMVDELRLPAAIEDVAKEIWLLYLSLFEPNYKPDFEPFGRDDEDYAPTWDTSQVPSRAASDYSAYETGSNTGEDDDQSDGDSAVGSPARDALPRMPTLAAIDAAVARLAVQPLSDPGGKTAADLDETANIHRDDSRAASSADESTFSTDNFTASVYSSDHDTDDMASRISDRRSDAGRPTDIDDEDDSSTSARKRARAYRFADWYNNPSWSFLVHYQAAGTQATASIGDDLHGETSASAAHVPRDNFPRLTGQVKLTWKTRAVKGTARVIMEDFRRSAAHYRPVPTVPAILYLACLWLRIPVLLQDIWHWTSIDVLPLQRPATVLPLKLVRQIPRHFQQQGLVMTKPGQPPYTLYHSQIFELVFLLNFNFDIVFPSLSHPPILDRLVDDLCLPTDPLRTVYTQTLPTYQELMNQFSWKLRYEDPVIPEQLAEASEFCDRYLDDYVQVAAHYLAYIPSPTIGNERASTFRSLNHVLSRLDKKEGNHWSPSLPFTRILSNSPFSSPTAAEPSPFVATEEPTAGSLWGEAERAYQEYQKYAHAQAVPADAMKPTEYRPLEAWEELLMHQEPQLTSSVGSAAASSSKPLSLPAGHLPAARFSIVPDKSSKKVDWTVTERVPRPLAVVLTRVSQVAGGPVSILTRQIKAIM
ncbi:hypothetical protein IWQ60_011949, partial [Tieghemiomyces parasiticus]